MKLKNYRGHLVLIIVNIIFGLNTPISKGVLIGGDVSALALTVLRFAGASVLFWLVGFTLVKEKVALKDIFLLFIASIFGVQINQMAYVVGLSMTSPIDASVTVTLTPVITMLLASLFMKEPITWKKGIGVFIGAVGAITLVLSSSGAAAMRDGASLEGNLLCILSSVAYAVYLTGFKGLIMRYSPITLMKWMFLFGALCCGPFCWKDITAIDYAALPAKTYLNMGYVIICATFITYMLIPVGQKLLRPTVVSTYNYMQPIISSLVAVAMGIGTFGWHKVVSAAIIFLGVYIVTQSKSRAQLDAEIAQKQRLREMEETTGSGGDQGVQAIVAQAIVAREKAAGYDAAAAKEQERADRE